MKKLLIFLIFCFSSFSLHSLEISIETGSFKNTGKSYLETYIRILGNTVEFKPLSDQSNLVQAQVKITIVISNGDKIVAFEKFILNSPEYTSPQDFLDVKRFALPEGQYTVKIEAEDGNDSANKLSLEKGVEVMSYTDPLNLSDIQLFAAVTPTQPSNPLAKNGLLMEPLTYGFIPQDIQVLNIYTEVYKDATIQQPHFIRYAIVDGYSNGVGNVSIQKFKKLEGKESEPLILKLPVDKLPSGKYHAVVELFDKEKNTISTRSANFLRSNPEYDIEYWRSYNKDEDYSFVSNLSDEELNYGLRAISAIVYEPKKSIMQYMITEAPIRAQRKFLLDFWKENAPSSPELSYQKFMEVAKMVDIEYNNNVGYGFETDRGYIFLRYGKPSNALSIETEPDSYPYEIWYYDYLKETNQMNVRFIFYNKTLVHNDYSLLHSTCIGEKQNPAWEVELYRKALDVQEGNPIDDLTVQDNWQRNARRYFNDY